jgi:hypothetical protein
MVTNRVIKSMRSENEILIGLLSSRDMTRSVTDLDLAAWRSASQNLAHSQATLHLGPLGLVVTLQWDPAHEGIEGNEIAHQCA